METNKLMEQLEIERQESIIEKQKLLLQQVFTAKDEMELLRFIACQLISLNTKMEINYGIND